MVHIIISAIRCLSLLSLFITWHDAHDHQCPEYNSWLSLIRSHYCANNKTDQNLLYNVVSASNNAIASFYWTVPSWLLKYDFLVGQIRACISPSLSSLSLSLLLYMYLCLYIYIIYIYTYIYIYIYVYIYIWTHIYVYIWPLVGNVRCVLSLNHLDVWL